MGIFGLKRREILKKIIAIILTLMLCVSMCGCAQLEYIFTGKEPETPATQQLPIVYERDIEAEIEVEKLTSRQYHTELNGFMKFDFYPNNVTLFYNGMTAKVEPTSIVYAKVIGLDGTNSTWYVAEFESVPFIFEKIGKGENLVIVYADDDKGTTYVVQQTGLTLNSNVELENNLVVDKYNAVELIEENENISSGYYIWNDGGNTYYSQGSKQYVLNKESYAWEEKTWNYPEGTSSVSGVQIWSDGNNIYYSTGTKHLVLNRETDTWENKTWYGFNEIQGYCVWNDGENTFYSKGVAQYVLNAETDTWEIMNWEGFSNISAVNVWSDGNNIYYSQATDQYVLDKETYTWEKSGFNSMPYFNGDTIWTDGQTVYYSAYSLQQVICVDTFSMESKTWGGIGNFSAGFSQETGVWTDGTNHYLTTKNKTYKFIKV